MFQSHNGAIAAVCRAKIGHEASTVSIPQWCDCCHLSGLNEIQQGVGFNPTMVRLLPIHATPSGSVNFGFNPTMVRLLPDDLGVKDLAEVLFQSHNGAIAAHLTCQPLQ